MKKSVVLIAGALTGIDRARVALAKKGTKVVVSVGVMSPPRRSF